jgi:hypothetical protein
VGTIHKDIHGDRGKMQHGHLLFLSFNSCFRCVCISYYKMCSVIKNLGRSQWQCQVMWLKMVSSLDVGILSIWTRLHWWAELSIIIHSLLFLDSLSCGIQHYFYLLFDIEHLMVDMPHKFPTLAVSLSKRSGWIKLHCHLLHICNNVPWWRKKTKPTI